MDSPISCLPNQILAEIFLHFKQLHLQQLRPVCTTWDFVISKFFEVSYRLSHANWEVLLKSPSRCLCGNISASIQFFPFPINSVAFKGFCERLQKLEFAWMSFDLTCMKILQSTNSLKELKLYELQFAESNSGKGPGSAVELLGNSEEVSTWLPKLTKLDFQKISTDLLKFIARIVQNGKLKEIVTDSWSRRKGFQEMIVEFLCYDLMTNPMVVNDPFLVTARAILDSNEETLQKLSTDSNELVFNSHTGFLHKCKLEILYDFFDPQLKISTNWMKAILEARMTEPFNLHLNELDLQLKDQQFDALTPEDITNRKRMESMISKIISRKNLTKIKLKFQGNFNWEPLWATDYKNVFSDCDTLKYLEFEYYTEDTKTETSKDNGTGRPIFRGIETLPKSLMYFSTNLPIYSTANMQDLNLKNLPNLHALRLCSTFNYWFIFKDRNAVVFTTEDAKMLAGKLPNLKILSLNLHDTKIKLDKTEFDGYERVTPDLIQRSRKKYYNWRSGPTLFLDVHLKQLDTSYEMESLEAKFCECL